jgi:CheY-like chemotaxis protein
MTRVLERSHHRVLQAASGTEALAALEIDHVDVVMSDHKMAQMSGVELYATACERHPHLRTRFVLMSGDPWDAELQAFATRTGLPVLAKPFSFVSLEDAIQSLVRS